MPIIASDYNPPFLLKNGHFSTIYAGIWRKIDDFSQKRERIDLADGDFLDVDWSFSTNKTKKVVILLHGLEGNAQRHYIAGSAKQLNLHGYDACSVNFRGCSGETNRLYRGYHSGATEDLDAVVQYLLNYKAYPEIYIKGFSLGGNMTLKYLGEGRALPAELKSAMAVSVPCHLRTCQEKLMSFNNFPYAKRFKKNLIQKLREKAELFPDRITKEEIDAIRTLKDFDDVYTSRAHGFVDCYDYYDKVSCLQFIPGIKLPVLLINAKNDTFLGPKCFPEAQAKAQDNFYLEMPKYGGHVGFHGQENITYTEKRVIKFFEEVI